VGIICPQYLVLAGSVPTQASLILAMYAAARIIPLALFALGTIYKEATNALLILGALTGATQLLDAGIGLFEHMISENALGRSLSPSSNFSWCICFTGQC
jgi:homoserine acetyltransferase